MLGGIEACKLHVMPSAVQGTGQVIGRDVAPIVQWPWDAVRDLEYAQRLQSGAILSIWPLNFQATMQLLHKPGSFLEVKKLAFQNESSRSVAV